MISHATSALDKAWGGGLQVSYVVRTLQARGYRVQAHM
jgi:hypothetical protein